MEMPLLASATALARRSDFVFVSTFHGANGFPDIRIMFNLLKLRASALERGPAVLPKPFASWLGTNTSSQKVGHVRKDPRICLYYADTATFEGLALQGTVSEVLDPGVRAALWTDAWEMYYPGGRDGGDFTVLQFHPEHGRYYHNLNVVDFDASLDHVVQA